MIRVYKHLGGGIENKENFTSIFDSLRVGENGFGRKRLKYDDLIFCHRFPVSETMMEPVTVAIVGVGGYGAVHVRAARALEGEGLIRISAVVIRSPEKYPREVADFRGKGVTVYNNFEDLLVGEKGRTEIIALPTAIHQHRDMTIMALEAGFNVLVEKPPAVTIQDLDAMIAAEKRSGRFCAVGFQFQSKTIVRRLKTLICEDGLGEIVSVSAKGKWKRLDSYYTRNTWAGKLMCDGEYVLDGSISNPLAHYLMNSLYLASREWGRAADPIKVRAELYRGHRIEGEDTACLEVEVSGGARIYFYTTLCNPVQSSPAHRIVGTKGVAEWTVGGDAQIIYSDGRRELIREDGKDERVEMFRNIARYVRGLDKEINCPLEMTRPFVLAVNGAYESARMIKDIPDRFLIKREESGSISTTIIGIEEIIDKAYESQQMYSDMGVEWAYRTDYFPLKGYRMFNLKM
ncbi:MAG: Gfo/Idh/MocA family oxidoreductase [Nitrososphaerota archaeon]|nr:Gfo/Idh/MocA family oxidoreductase [Candidatus Bathyarchaeota archaeon]MDW8049078.1 Gfo/Idh/MocA family oxidoreductase [Nitrososphaerota archaeon]